MNLEEHIRKQRDFSIKTFGPARGSARVIDHITKELAELIAKPNDLEEWIDIILLAIDGAWREGYTPKEITAALRYKQNKNESRKCPDWRTAEPGKAIEHIKGE